jgi:hypothetical protein
MMRVIRFTALAALIACLAAASAQAQSKRPPVPAGIQLLKIVRMTITAVHQANSTGNYTVLRDLGTPGFASANSAAHLADIFRRWREPDRNLDPVLVLKPVWLVKPVVDRRGVLSLKGYFKTTPLRVRFVMKFKPVARRWRLEAISLKTFKPGKRRQPARRRR